MADHPDLTWHRLAIAQIEDHPPSPNEHLQFGLCRKLQRSHESLLIAAAEAKGSWSAFALSVAIPLHKALTQDLRYWHAMVTWCNYHHQAWSVAFRRGIEKMETLPDLAEDVSTEIARGLGIPVDFLRYYVENKAEVVGFLEMIRGDLATMAELQLFRLIASGDPATIRWALPRLDPKRYGDRKVDEQARVTDIVIQELEHVASHDHPGQALPAPSGDPGQQETQQPVTASTAVR